MTTNSNCGVNTPMATANAGLMMSLGRRSMSEFFFTRQYKKNR